MLEDDFKASILLVDDRPENLIALEATLEPLGQRLVKANSGNEALRHVLTEDFALILMDVQMPGMDGFETAALIKERERARYIPIIFVTAISQSQQHVFKGYEAGAVDFLPKPIDADILKSKVMVFVDLYKKTDQIKRQAELLDDPTNYFFAPSDRVKCSHEHSSPPYLSGRQSPCARRTQSHRAGSTPRGSSSRN